MVARLALGIACFLLFPACAPGEEERLIREVVADRASSLARADQREIVDALVRAERRTGVDALLLLSMIEEESDFKPRARSRRGALGLLQVRPATGKDVAVRNDIPWDGDGSLLEPRTNVLIGATYLSELHARFGSWELALTAYNRGPAKTKQPSRYAERVVRRYEDWRREVDD